MISETVLKRGLAALGEAYSRKVDATTEGLWRHALRELTDEQFRHGVDTVIRGDGRFFPPPGVVLAAGFDAPRPTPPPKTLIRPGETCWRDAAQEQHVMQVVRDNPISKIEMGTDAGALRYIHRIAVAAGLCADWATVGREMPRTPGEEG